MDKKETIAVLFDFDGVVMDTETQYSVFWNELGLKYVNIENFDNKIKGQTLNQIFNNYFSGQDELQKQIEKDVDLYEQQMNYDYFPGFEDFLADLKKHDVKTALVTSSNEKKMSIVYKVHPELTTSFDVILTADSFTRSKPDPECFLLAMEKLDAKPGNTFVFEDSFHGLGAGRASGATVIGMATTNPREAIAGKADYVLDDFQGMTYSKLLGMQKKA